MKRILKFTLKGTLIVFSLFLLLGFYGLMFPSSPEQRAKWAAEAAARAEFNKTDAAKQAEADKAHAAGRLSEALKVESAAMAAKNAAEAKAKAADPENDLPPSIVKSVISAKLRDPESAVFGSVNIYNDRKFGKLGLVTVACGSVNSKNGFGGMAGSTNFIVFKLFYLAEIDPKRNNALFVKHWNKLCAGDHRPGPHYSDYTMSSAMVFPTE